MLPTSAGASQSKPCAMPGRKGVAHNCGEDMSNEACSSGVMRSRQQLGAKSQRLPTHTLQTQTWAARHRKKKKKHVSAAVAGQVALEDGGDGVTEGWDGER